MVNYVSQVDEVDKLCAQADIKDQEDRRNRAVQVAKTNQLSTTLRRSQQQQQQKREMYSNQNEIASNLNSDFLSETGGTSIMDFKGFSPEVRANYEAQNVQMVQNRLAASQQVKMDDIEEAKANIRLGLQVQREETNQANYRQQQNLYQSKHLEQQRQEASEWAAKDKIASRGVIGADFFAAFGTSER